MPLLFAVLAVLFLMHGLSHGATHHAGTSDQAAAHAVGATHFGTTAVEDVIADLPALEAPAHGGGHAAQLAELCMAVLVGGLLLVLLTRRGGTPGVARARRTHQGAGALASTGRLPDPPDLLRLSVCRC